MSPIVIFDGDFTGTSSLRKSTIKSSMKKPSKTIEEKPIPPKPKKSYAMKYRVIKIRCQEPTDETTNLDLSKYLTINLKSVPFFGFERPPGYEIYLQSHTGKLIQDQLDSRSPLIDLLSRRQARINYSTN